MDELPAQLAPAPEKQPVDNITIKIAGKKWILQYVDDLRGSVGWCDKPWRKKGRKIQILVNQPEREEADTICHEICHGANWHLSEKNVTEIANAISETLWLLGWRRNPDLGPVFNVQKADFTDDPPCEETHE